MLFGKKNTTRRLLWLSLAELFTTYLQALKRFEREAGKLALRGLICVRPAQEQRPILKRQQVLAKSQGRLAVGVQSKVCAQGQKHHGNRWLNSHRPLQKRE
jgi:hypothetical protein